MIQASQTIVKEFNTWNGVGGLADADTLPVGTLIINGANNAATVTIVSKGSAGRYTATVTMPSSVVVGDIVQIYVAATVETIPSGGMILDDVVGEPLILAIGTSGDSSTTTKIYLGTSSTTNWSILKGCSIRIANQIRTITGGTDGEIIFPDYVNVSPAFDVGTALVPYVIALDLSPVLDSSLSVNAIVVSDISGDPQGAYLRTFIVKYGTEVVQGATVRVTKSGETGFGTTDSDGYTELSMDAGTWKITITAPGYQFTPTNLSVTGNSVSPTIYQVTKNTVSLPDDLTYCTIYGFTRDASGTAVPNKTVEFKLRRTDVTTGIVITDSTETTESDTNGYFEIALPKGWAYDVRPVGLGNSQRIEIGDDDTQEVPVVIG